MRTKGDPSSVPVCPFLSSNSSFLLSSITTQHEKKGRWKNYLLPFHSLTARALLVIFSPCLSLADGPPCHTAGNNRSYPAARRARSVLSALAAAFATSKARYCDSARRTGRRALLRSPMGRPPIDSPFSGPAIAEASSKLRKIAYT